MKGFVLALLLAVGVRADIELSRSITSVGSGDSGSIFLASGCTSQDAHGSNDCKLNWGDSDTATISGVLSTDLGPKARVDVDLKVDGLIPWKFSCNVCGDPCEITVPVIKKKVTVKLGPCPISKGSYSNKTESFTLPSKSPVPVKISASGSATLYDDSGAVVIAGTGQGSVSPSSLVSPLSQVFITPDFSMVTELIAQFFGAEVEISDLESPELFKCNQITGGCQTCVEKQLIVGYPCYFCEIDNKCHDVGSMESPCTPPSADEKCVSLSTFSNCALKTVSDCPANATAPNMGAGSNIANDDADMMSALNAGMILFNQQSNSLYLHMPVRVVKASSQVVAGLKYTIEIQMGESSCLKSFEGERTLKVCPVSGSVQNYELTIWDQPWSTPRYQLTQHRPISA